MTHNITDQNGVLYGCWVSMVEYKLVSKVSWWLQRVNPIMGTSYFEG